MNTEQQAPLLAQKPKLPLWGSIPLYLLACLLFILGWSVLLTPFTYIPISNPIYEDISYMFVYSVASLLGVCTASIVFLKHIDRCPITELGLSIKGRWKECVVGVLFAAVLYFIGFTASLMLGALEITSVSWDFGILLATFCYYFVAAAMEEVMVRGYIQGRLMTQMNKFGALCLASLIFAALHLFNNNLTPIAMLNLFLAGLMLGASYMYTRNLWFPIFLHTAWNWIQGAILGYEVSGGRLSPSVVTLHLPEKNIINGGPFGFEGSIICTILTILATVIIIGWYSRGKR